MKSNRTLGSVVRLFDVLLFVLLLFCDGPFSEGNTFNVYLRGKPSLSKAFRSVKTLLLIALSRWDF